MMFKNKIAPEKRRIRPGCLATRKVRGILKHFWWREKGRNPGRIRRNCHFLTKSKNVPHRTGLEPQILACSSYLEPPLRTTAPNTIWCLSSKTVQIPRLQWGAALFGEFAPAFFLIRPEFSRIWRIRPEFSRDRRIRAGFVPGANSPNCRAIFAKAQEAGAIL